MTHETIETETGVPVLLVRLNRPAVLNSLDATMIEELAEVFTAAAADDTIRVVLITGAGRAFCAGADLKGVQEGLSPKHDGSADFLQRIGEVFELVRACPKPVIAALNGLTLAGGLELALRCDVVIAAESARIGDAHSNFGLISGAGGAALLPGRIGLNNAKLLLLTGEHFPARHFLSLGLVQQVVADDDLLATARTLADKLAAKSPLVLRRMKEIANASMDLRRNEALHLEMAHVRRHLRSHDMNEGLAAFAEKRSPVFKGY